MLGSLSQTVNNASHFTPLNYASSYAPHGSSTYDSHEVSNGQNANFEYDSIMTKSRRGSDHNSAHIGTPSSGDVESIITYNETSPSYRDHTPKALYHDLSRNTNDHSIPAVNKNLILSNDATMKAKESFEDALNATGSTVEPDTNSGPSSITLVLPREMIDMTITLSSKTKPDAGSPKMVVTVETSKRSHPEVDVSSISSSKSRYYHLPFSSHGSRRNIDGLGSPRSKFVRGNHSVMDTGPNETPKSLPSVIPFPSPPPALRIHSHMEECNGHSPVQMPRCNHQRSTNRMRSCYSYRPPKMFAEYPEPLFDRYHWNHHLADDSMKHRGPRRSHNGAHRIYNGDASRSPRKDYLRWIGDSVQAKVSPHRKPSTPALGLNKIPNLNSAKAKWADSTASRQSPSVKTNSIPQIPMASIPLSNDAIDTTLEPPLSRNPDDLSRLVRPELSFSTIGQPTEAASPMSIEKVDGNPDQTRGTQHRHVSFSSTDPVIHIYESEYSPSSRNSDARKSRRRKDIRCILKSYLLCGTFGEVLEPIIPKKNVPSNDGTETEATKQDTRFRAMRLNLLRSNQNETL